MISDVEIVEDGCDGKLDQQSKEKRKCGQKPGSTAYHIGDLNALLKAAATLIPTSTEKWKQVSI